MRSKHYTVGGTAKRMAGLKSEDRSLKSEVFGFRLGTGRSREDHS